MNTKANYLSLLADFKIKRAVIYGINKIGIFGSVARNEQTSQSDVDIYYEGNSLSLFKTAALKEELENLLHCPVDLVRLRESMNASLKTRIETEGVYV
ncbi:MAG: nucleotidyltransferase family protein [Mangrovibacterium sp.]